MTRLLCILLTLLFSLSGSAMGEYSDFGCWSIAAKGGGIVTGLETRRLRPAPGTRVRPEDVPMGWTVQPTKRGGGVQYVNPANSNQNVRVMQGNPNSPHPNSQAPYVRQQNTGGTYLRQDGTPSPLPKGGLHDGDAHIPLDQFIFRP